MNRSLIALPLVALVAFVGCRTNKDILNDYEKDVLAGNYAHAAVEVSEKAKDTGVDQLLWRLQAGGAYYLTADGEKAIGYFDGAEDIFITNDGESVFAQGATGAGAMMTNDRVFPFAGGGQDRIFTCLYKAVDYAAANKVDAVRTELNRACAHQENWIYERRRDIVAAQERLDKEASEYANKNKAELKDNSTVVSKAFADETFAGQIKDKTGFDPAVDGNLDLLSQKDYMNVYVQHASGVFRLLTGDSGREYFKGLPSLAPGSSLIASDWRDAEAGVRPQSQVWIYVEDGMCPCREEWRLDLPLILIPYLNRFIMYTGMAIPYLRYRDGACPEYSVQAGGTAQSLEVIQDMDQLFKVEHDVYMRGALAREITRVVVKAGVQVALGVVAENCVDNYTKIALRASQVGAATWAASVTQADLRSWTSLPKKVYAMRVNRPADGKITLTGGGSKVAEITVPEGNTMVFVRKPSAAAPAMVKTFTQPN